MIALRDQLAVIGVDPSTGLRAAQVVVGIDGGTLAITTSLSSPPGLLGGSRLLLEDGASALLLEDGNYLLMEA